ncbi:MAG: HAD hydrolase-like protein, partial [Henriciella sp.]|nr:HAD hydrolase-like protein [Henriciella sp.]
YEQSFESLEQLSAQGATLAVCTNKTQQLAEEVLRELAGDHYFAATLGGDLAASPKPDGKHILETIARAGGHPERAIMIGDSSTDEKAARDAKLPFVFVTFGYGQLSEEPFESLRVIDHWRDMQTALLELKT